MDSVSSLNSVVNLVLENNLYQQSLETHKICGSCLSCDSDLQKILNENINDLSELLLYLSQRSKASPEASAFSTKIEEKFICQCSEYTGKRDISIQRLTVSALDCDISIQNLLKHEIKKKSGNFCTNSECEYKKSSFKLRIQSLSNLLISISWQNKSLKTLLYFLLSLESTLDLRPIYKQASVVYLQGMILCNSHKSVFITLQPCRIYSSIGKFTEISLKFLNFLIIQYSLYPSMIVYNASCEPSNFSEISKQFEGELNNYLDFLSGDCEVQSQICFLCWNNSHEYCLQVKCVKGWNCKCGYCNPNHSLFCLNCGFRLREKSENDFNECLACSKILESTYCADCFFLANCWSCDRKITKTQLFGCPVCLSWASSMSCITCKSDLSDLKVQCFSCFTKNYCNRSQCKHNNETLSCIICMYDFTCAVCFQLKSVHEKKNCAICLTEIIDGICSECKKNQLPCNYICIDCVYSSKKCSKNHAVTKYTKTICKSCSNRDHLNFDKKSKNLEVCIECEVPLNSYLGKNCILCCIGNKDHSCINYLACEECFEYLDQCPCGTKVLSRTDNCPNCSESVGLNSNFKKLMIQNEEQKDWNCENCGFSNDLKTIFCENCNSAKEVLMENSSCKVCSRESCTEYCKKCKKIGNCCGCRKELLVGQGYYCKFCFVRSKDRVCYNCKRVLLKTQILCYICSVSSNTSNSKISIIC